MIRHHFPNVADPSGGPAALVSTRAEGSPLVAAPGHTVQVALTPAAAAALLRTLEGQTLPADVADLVAGLRAAAVDALERACPSCCGGPCEPGPILKTL